MSPHNFSRNKTNEYISHPNFVNSKQYQIESSIESIVYRGYKGILSIPRRFWAALKRRVLGRSPNTSIVKDIKNDL